MSEQFVQQYIQQLQPSNRVALDIGANIGMYTLPISDKFKQVYAFEPHPDNQKTLRDNILKYNKTNIDIIPKCISNITGTIKLNTNPGNIGGHTINNKVATHKEWGFENTTQIEVPCVTLDEFCKDLDVGFMKVDIEGAEDFVFEGAKEVLSRENLNIMIEIHNEVDRPKLFDFFRSFGFKIGGLGLSISLDEQLNTKMLQMLIEVKEFNADDHYLMMK